MGTKKTLGRSCCVLFWVLWPDVEFKALGSCRFIDEYWSLSIFKTDWATSICRTFSKHLRWLSWRTKHATLFYLFIYLFIFFGGGTKCATFFFSLFFLNHLDSWGVFLCMRVLKSAAKFGKRLYKCYMSVLWFQWHHSSGFRQGKLRSCLLLKRCWSLVPFIVILKGSSKVLLNVTNWSVFHPCSTYW